MLIQQNSNQQTQHRSLIRDVFQIEAIRHPRFTRHLVEPAERPHGFHRRQLIEQPVATPQPPNPLVGLLPVIHPLWPQAAFNRRLHPVSQLLRRHAVQHRGRNEIQPVILLHLRHHLLRHRNLPAALCK